MDLEGDLEGARDTDRDTDRDLVMDRVTEDDWEMDRDTEDDWEMDRVTEDDRDTVRVTLGVGDGVGDGRGTVVRVMFAVWASKSMASTLTTAPSVYTASPGPRRASSRTCLDRQLCTKTLLVHSGRR